MTEELEDAIMRLKEFDGTPFIIFTTEGELRNNYSGTSFDKDYEDARISGELKKPFYDSERIDVPSRNSIGIHRAQTMNDAEVLKKELKKRSSQGNDNSNTQELSSMFDNSIVRANLAARYLALKGYLFYNNGANLRGGDSMILWVRL
jgi:hypothetical protein